MVCCHQSVTDCVQTSSQFIVTSLTSKALLHTADCFRRCYCDSGKLQETCLPQSYGGLLRQMESFGVTILRGSPRFLEKWKA